MLSSIAPRALRAAGGRTLPAVCSSSSTINNAALRQRWLSTSPSLKGGHIITFGETSTPELADILQNLRQKVFLPTYLSAEQRKRMYNPKLASKLQHDPIIMEIDGVVHQFRHVNPVSSLPNTQREVVRAIDAMTTRSDFANLTPLLEGCVRANRKLAPWTYPFLIRRAALHNALPVIMECIKAPARTGFRLDTSETINQLLLRLQQPAIDSDFDERKTAHALKQVRLVLNILESAPEAHAPQPQSRGAFPFHRDPQILAARLHLAAARAVHHQGGQDTTGQVTRYAAELVSLWPEGAGLLDLQPDEAYRSRARSKWLLERNTYLLYASPVLSGLQLAAQVVDPGLAMQLQNRADAVEGEVRAALESEERKAGGEGERMYKRLFEGGEGEEGEVA